jgi:uncharacterized protein (TIGR02118 family)
MIKVIELLVRKPGMSRAEFSDYWRRVHGPLVMSIPEIRRHNVKYVQSHTLGEWHPFLAGEEPLFDGAAEIWVDSMDAASALFAEPKFAELVVPDEVQFLDRSKTEILVLTEHLVYQRPSAPVHGGVKLFEVPVRRKGMSRADCHRYWRDVHGPMVRHTPSMVANMRRYSQSHTVLDDIPAVGPMRYDGLAELWFDTAADLAACFGEQYLATVHPDEPNFVDLDGSTAFMASEHLIYERPR